MKDKEELLYTLSHISDSIEILIFRESNQNLNISNLVQVQKYLLKEIEEIKRGK